MNPRLLEVFKYFLRLGFLGFGGPLALVSSMQKHCVEEEKWLSQEEFNSSFALIKAMPGPIAFMTAVFLGRLRAGFFGALLAGFTLNFPAFCLMILFSMFFSSLSHFTFIHVLMIGMQVSALGVILGSLKGLVKGREKSIFFWFLVIISGVINYFYPSVEALIIIGFGVMLVAQKKLYDLGALALVCFKAGALVFGSGLAIVPMLENDVVTKNHWLTHSEFLDALAFGQMTPGPVVITATYIGHKLYGMNGAVIATLCIFAASFFHMTTWFPHVVKKLNGKSWIQDFVFGAVAAVTGPIIVAVIKLGIGVGITPFLAVIGAGSFILTLNNKFPVWALIPTGGLVYYVFSIVY